MNKESQHREDGRVGMLMCAGCAFICLFLFVSIAITTVAMEDRRLLSCADRLASAATVGTSGTTSYEASSPVPSRAELGEKVDAALADMASSTCDVGEGVEVVQVEIVDADVQVSVRARAKVGVIPPVLRALAAPTLERSSTARLREM